MFRAFESDARVRDASRSGVVCRVHPVAVDRAQRHRQPRFRTYCASCQGATHIVGCRLRFAFSHRHAQSVVRRIDCVDPHDGLLSTRNRNVPVLSEIECPLLNKRYGLWEFVENPFWGFSKQRWARSWRPRLRQLPQALHGWAARSARAPGRWRGCLDAMDGPHSAERADVGRWTAAAASRSAWASPARRSPSTASGAPDSESQSRRSRSRAPAPCFEPAPGGSAAPLENTRVVADHPVVRQHARLLELEHAIERGATRCPPMKVVPRRGGLREAGVVLGQIRRLQGTHSPRSRPRSPIAAISSRGDPDASRDCARPVPWPAANSRR